MTAKLVYGSEIVLQIEDETQARGLAALIGRIIGAGKTQWLPVPGAGEERIDLLITPGVPVAVTGLTWQEDAKHQVTGLLREYDADPAALPVPGTDQTRAPRHNGRLARPAVRVTASHTAAVARPGRRQSTR